MLRLISPFRDGMLERAERGLALIVGMGFRGDGLMWLHFGEVQACVGL